MLDWITSLLASTGYLGIALLMLLENLLPPIPSELIMPLAGFTAARGELNLVGVVLAGSLGSLLGALFWYQVGRMLGLERLTRLADRHGRWLTVTGKDIAHADAWFDRHGHKAVLLGRMVPTVRTLISVPAGLSGMSLPRFLLYSGLGTLAWTSLLAVGGYLLESRYELIGAWLDPIAKLILALIVLVYLWRLVTFRPQRG